MLVTVRAAAPRSVISSGSSVTSGLAGGGCSLGTAWRRSPDAAAGGGGGGLHGLLPRAVVVLGWGLRGGAGVGPRRVRHGGGLPSGRLPSGACRLGVGLGCLGLGRRRLGRLCLGSLALGCRRPWPRQPSAAGSARSGLGRIDLCIRRAAVAAAGLRGEELPPRLVDEEGSFLYCSCISSTSHSLSPNASSGLSCDESATAWIASSATARVWSGFRPPRLVLRQDLQHQPAPGDTPDLGLLVAS
jgi:hypothetical protein